MEPSIATVPHWLLTTLGAISALALIGGAAELLGSIADIDVVRHRTLRLGCTLVSALLVGTNVLGLLPRWGLAAACVGFLFGLQAMAIEFARLPTLHDYLRRRRAGEDPAGGRSSRTTSGPRYRGSRTQARRASDANGIRTRAPICETRPAVLRSIVAPGDESEPPRWPGHPSTSLPRPISRSRSEWKMPSAPPSWSTI
jgi:hypothetical protein